MMKDDRGKSFFGEFLKWFFIWEFIGLIFRGIAYLVKMIFLAFKQLIWLIGLGIRKLTPIIIAKWKEFCIAYNTRYKPKMLIIWNKFKNYAKKGKEKARQKVAEWISKYKSKKRKKISKWKLMKEWLKIKYKKIKYCLTDLYYRYELQVFFSFIFIIIILFIIVIIQNK